MLIVQANVVVVAGIKYTRKAIQVFLFFLVTGRNSKYKILKY